MTKKILIIGATSAIAQKTARLFAKDKAQIYLFGRNDQKLCEIKKDLEIRGAIVHHEAFDFNQNEQIKLNLDQVWQELSTIDICLIAHGSLPDQKACEQDENLSLKEIHTNGLSAISFLHHLANFFQKQKSGTLAVITSVAGDRGRSSNYVYGSAKAMVSTYLSGLRGRLFEFGVRVLDIKPGFVDTPMTAHIEPKGFLWAQPEKIAQVIHSAIQKEKNKTLYVPWFWRPIMMIIKRMPEFLFKKMKF